MKTFALLLLAVVSVQGLFEWLHPSSKSHEAHEQVYIEEYEAEMDIKERGNQIAQAVKEEALEAKEQIKEKMQESSNHVKDAGLKTKYFILFDARDAALEHLINPIRRFFNPQRRDSDETEWLYQALLSTTPPKHFFRTFPDEYILFVDCPGIPPSVISVTLAPGRTIRIQGSHEACIEERGKGGREDRLCVNRHVDQEYRFPEDVNPDAVESAIRDGVLAIRFPRLQTVGRAVPVRQVKTGF